MYNTFIEQKLFQNFELNFVSQIFCCDSFQSLEMTLALLPKGQSYILFIYRENCRNKYKQHIHIIKTWKSKALQFIYVVKYSRVAGIHQMGFDLFLFL
jgi:hypothetical protein